MRWPGRRLLVLCAATLPLACGGMRAEVVVTSATEPSHAEHGKSGDATRPAADGLRRAVEGRLAARAPARPESAVVVAVAEDGAEVVVGRGRVGPTDGSVRDGNTVFLLGSVTKVFTGILLADAVTDGRVRIDAPVSQLLPLVPVPTHAGVSPTLLQLATHTSGLPHMFDNWRPSPSELVALLRTCTLLEPPGERVRYSNVGYALLGDAVAAARGLGYAEAIRSRITAPLGMTQTGVMWTSPRSQRAQGYDAEWAPVPDSANVPTLAPCCALESSANDLLRLVRAHWAHAPSLLGHALQRAALPVLQGSGAWDDRMLGLGWYVTVPDGVLWKNGLMAGYRSTVLVDRRARRGVVVLANQSAVDTDLIAFEVLRDVSLLRDEQAPPTTFDAPPTSATQTAASFARGLRLVGYESAARVRRGEALELALYFVKDRPLDADLKIVVQSDPAGTRRRLHGDHFPQSSTASWPVGKVVRDTVRLFIPRDAELGERRLFLGFLSGRDRLVVTEGCSAASLACGPRVRIE